jgi:N-methylhydantoinase A
MGSWPAVSPVSPGVLCALGDATTRMRTESARSFSKRVSQTSAEELADVLKDMAGQIRAELEAEDIPADDISVQFEIDVRYSGQAFEVPMDVMLDEFETKGLPWLTGRFDEEHRRLFTFNMDVEHEIVNLRAVALGKTLDLPAAQLPMGDGDPSPAKLRDHEVWMNGAMQQAVIYDRSKLRQGDIIVGPAIVTEMDSTTLIEAGCTAKVDAVGNILINLA